MKKMYFMVISIFVCALIFFACEQTDFSELDSEGTGSNNTTPVVSSNEDDQEEDKVIDCSSIIYLNRDWKKNENSIPFHLPSGQPNRGFLERFEFSDDKGIYQNEGEKLKVHKNCNTCNSPFWVINSRDELITVAEYPKGFNEYEDSYFLENILILWKITHCSGSIANWIDSLDVNGNTLTINTLRFYPGMGTADMQYRICEIQVKKEDIAGIENVEMVTKNICNVPEYIVVTILDNYLTKELTLNDFGWDNFAEIQYDHLLFSGKMRMIRLELEKPGTKHARAAIEHCEKLGFVQYAWYE